MVNIRFAFTSIYKCVDRHHHVIQASCLKALLWRELSDGLTSKQGAWWLGQSLLYSVHNCYVHMFGNAVYVKTTETQPTQRIKAWTKQPPFCRRHFETHFLEKKNNTCISIQNSFNSVIDNEPALVHVMACYRRGDYPLPGGRFKNT